MPTLETAPLENPGLSPLVRVYAVLLLLVLAGGASLLFGEPTVTARWPWPLSPYAARFMGAIYVSEFLAATMLLVVNRVAPGRMILAMAFPFALLGAVVPFFYPELFDFSRRKSILWLVLYGGSAAVIVAFLWQHRRLRHPAVDIGGGWRAFFLVQGCAIALYGLALLVAPAVATAFWPWPVNRFDAQFYSGVFIAVGCGGLILWRSAAVADVIAFGMIEVCFGGALLVALALAAEAVPPGAWDEASATPWIWIGGCVALILLGLAGIASAMARPRSRPRPVPV